MVSGPHHLAQEDSARPVAQVQLHFALLCRRATAPLSKPGLCLTNFIRKKQFLMFRSNLLCSSVYPLPLVLNWRCSGLLLYRCLYVPGRSLWAFSQTTVWENQCFLNLFSWRMSRKSGHWPLNLSTDLLKNGLKSEIHYCKLRSPTKVIVFSQSHIYIIRTGRGQHKFWKDSEDSSAWLFSCTVTCPSDLEVGKCFQGYENSCPDLYIHFLGLMI